MHRSNHPLIAACTLFTALLIAPTLLAQTPPATPVIQEPELDGQIVNRADVHMETSAFSDADPGDTHLCTDWEIWTIAPAVLAWQGLCVSGPEAVHSHLGDGTFVNAHATLTELLPDTDYRLRVRHRDSSANAATAWSAWAERLFTTGPTTEIFPLEIDDIEVAPPPTWQGTTGTAIVLPSGTSTAPTITVETAAGTLLEFRGLDGVSNVVINPGELTGHEPVRVRIAAGDVAPALLLPASDISFVDHDGDAHSLYLPAINTAAGTESYFWISESGASYEATAGQADPSFAVLARGAPVPWQMQVPGYRVEVVATGFQLPVNIAFVPSPGLNPGDPLYYVTELYGTIKVVTRDGTVSDYATNLIDFTPTGNFPGSGEQGLTGIAVDPANGDVVASLLYDGGGPHYPKVVRFSSVDGGLTASSQTTLLDMVGESQGQSHQISNVSFGLDGKLYVHMGDGFDASTAQNLASYRGKILRLNTDGSAPNDNPLYNVGNGINATDFVYAYGVRNPFGGAWRTADGFLYQVENGPSTDRFVRVTPGQNFLWNGANSSMLNFAIVSWTPAVGPTNLAFVQSTTHGGSGFPAGVQGRAFIAESGPTWASGTQNNGKRIRSYELDPTGALISGPNDFVRYVGTGKATVVALAAGPDGLYFSDFYKDNNFTGPTDVGANILRIRFEGAADFTADVTTGDAPLAVQFTDVSTVPGASGWLWDFGDGFTSNSQNPGHTYTVDGIYDVSLAVTGAHGIVIAEKHAFVRVGDLPRIAFIGNALPLSTSDAAIVGHLGGLGYDVTAYDDEPVNRPSAAQLAGTHDLVVISSTVGSGNIAGEFRDEVIPVIFWEQALLTTAREPLASSGNVVGGVTAIDVIDNTHPITSALSLGTHTVFASGSAMSVGFAPHPVGAQVLARRAGALPDAALIVADTGAPLLGGHLAPARRVFFFLEDSSWLAATSTTQSLLERAISWALGTAESFERGDCNGDGGIDISDPVMLLAFLFASGTTPQCHDACDGNDDGNLNVADAVTTLGYLFGSTGPLPTPNTCGVDPTQDPLTCATPTCP